MTPTARAVKDSTDPKPPEPASERLGRIRTQVAELFAGPVIPDLLELAMATAISPRVVPHGPPVWLLCEGPPSRGKTAAVDLLKATADGADRLTVFAPKITLGSLTSGFKDSRTSKRAPALLKEFNDRCWCNTEFSTLLTGDSKSVAPILGSLTAAFDGDFRAAFGNVTEQKDSSILDLKSRFSLLGCITPQVRQQHAKLLSQLGPRFLSYRLLPLTDEEQRDAFRLMREPRRAAQLKDLQALVKAHMLATLKEALPVTVPDEADAILQVLSKLVAAGRTPVNFREGVPIVEGAEDPLRVYQQLLALLIALAKIEGTFTPSPRALRLVRDVALSSFEPQRAEALTVQRTSPVIALPRFHDGEPPAWRHGLTISRLEDVSGWSNDTAARVIDELVALGLYVVDKESAMVDTVRPGSRPTLYVPIPALLCVLNATFEEHPPRLVSAIEMLWGPDDLDGRLSPPDARLAAALAECRVERLRELAGLCRQIHEEHPELPPEYVSLLAIQRATGIKWLPDEEIPVDA
jgi:hypothetical protein